MHETSLGAVITDYLSGEALPETSYEPFRQALARLLVEERGYPRERLRRLARLEFEVAGERYCRVVDLLVSDPAGEALLPLFFCSGNVGSYLRESLAAARLLAAPLVAVTDTRTALLAAADSGEALAEGMEGLPRWERLAELAAAHPAPELSNRRRSMEARILHTYSGFLKCCEEGPGAEGAACRALARYGPAPKATGEKDA